MPPATHGSSLNMLSKLSMPLKTRCRDRWLNRDDTLPELPKNLFCRDSISSILSRRNIPPNAGECIARWQQTYSNSTAVLTRSYPLNTIPTSNVGWILSPADLPATTHVGCWRSVRHFDKQLADEQARLPLSVYCLNAVPTQGGIIYQAFSFRQGVRFRFL